MWQHDQQGATKQLCWVTQTTTWNWPIRFQNVTGMGGTRPGWKQTWRLLKMKILSLTIKTIILCSMSEKRYDESFVLLQCSTTIDVVLRVWDCLSLSSSVVTVHHHLLQQNAAPHSAPPCRRRLTPADATESCPRRHHNSAVDGTKPSFNALAMLSNLCFCSNS